MNTEYNRIKKYKEAAKITLEKILNENKDANKYELIKNLRAKTHVKQKGFVLPKHTQKICEEVVLEHLRNCITIDSNPMLPKCGSTEISNQQNPCNSISNFSNKRLKTLNDNSYNTNVSAEKSIDYSFLFVKDPLSVHVKDYFIGSTELIENIQKHIYALTLGLQNINNMILLVGEQKSGKTHCIRYSIKNAFNNILNKPTCNIKKNVSSIGYIEIDSIDIIRSYDSKSFNSNRVNFFQDLFRLIQTFDSDLIIFIDNFDRIFVNLNQISSSSISNNQSNCDNKKSSFIQNDFISFLDSLNEIDKDLLLICSVESLNFVEESSSFNIIFNLSSYAIHTLTNVQKIELLLQSLRYYSKKYRKTDNDSDKIKVNLDFNSLLPHSKYMNGWNGGNIDCLARSIIDYAITDSIIIPDNTIDINKISCAEEKDTLELSPNFLESKENKNTCNNHEITCINVDFSHFEKMLSEGIFKFRKTGFNDIPDISFDDVGGLDEIKEVLQHNFIDIVLNIDEYRSVGLQDASGLLFWGPPGCGKTHLAKALANACNAQFILVNGAEVLNKYLGESEKHLRTIFRNARDNAPALIFFDEFDALCPARDSNNLHEVTRRLVNTFLTELDGFRQRSGVFVVAATNQPDLIDPAVLRSGRFEHKVYLPPPDAKNRKKIIKIIVSKAQWVLSENEIDEIVSFTEGYSGADLKFSLNQAAAQVWRTKNKMKGAIHLNKNAILENLKGPSISMNELKKYEALKQKYGLINV